MSKIIEVNKPISKGELDKKLTKLSNKKSAIDLGKYSGKVNFGVDGLDYQLKVRDEWR